jgi:hypothetical protein
MRWRLSITTLVLAAVFAAPASGAVPRPTMTAVGFATDGERYVVTNKDSVPRSSFRLTDTRTGRTRTVPAPCTLNGFADATAGRVLISCADRSSEQAVISLTTGAVTWLPTRMPVTNGSGSTAFSGLGRRWVRGITECELYRYCDVFYSLVSGENVVSLRSEESFDLDSAGQPTPLRECETHAGTVRYQYPWYAYRTSAGLWLRRCGGPRKLVTRLTAQDINLSAGMVTWTAVQSGWRRAFGYDITTGKHYRWWIPGRTWDVIHTRDTVFAVRFLQDLDIAGYRAGLYEFDR